MIKQGIKNYFVSLKYIFTVIGTLALGVIVGLSILIPCVISSISTLIDDVVRIFSSIELDPQAVWNYLSEAVLALDFGNPAQAVGTMLSEEWLMKTLNGCLDELLGGKVAIENSVAQAVVTCTGSIAVGVVAFLLMTVLGLIGGFYFTKWLIRRSIAKRSIWKFILITLFDGVMTVALVAVNVWLASLWWASAIFTSVVSVLLVGAVALLEAYLVHGRGKVEFKRVVNIKNVLKLLLTNIILLAISIALTALAVLINVVVGIFIGLGIITIGIIVIGLNAEAYVKSLAQSEPEQKPAEA